MEGGIQRSPYYREHYQLSNPYATNPSPEISERPRPASVQDLEFGEMYDSGIHAHSSSPRINQTFIDPISSLGTDHRTASLDRRNELYGTLRSNFDSQSEHLTKPTIHHQSYGLKSLNSNPGLSAILNPNNPNNPSNPSNRRAHSYDMNLEKQGLTDYNNLLAAAGLGTNPSLYGYNPNSLFDYSGLTLPTLQSFCGLDYNTLQQQQQQQQKPTTFPNLLQPTNLLNMNPTCDLSTLQRECFRLQHELNGTKEKLNACTASIRTFWSPELKRERSMRKEENAKYAILADHLHQLQLEKQTMLETLHNMESDLRHEREKRNRRFIGTGDHENGNELDLAKRQIDELTLENRQLKKSVEEADRRTSNIKASLNATEDSLRRLVDAVKAGKSSASATVPTTGATEGTTTSVDQNALPSIKLERIEADRAEINRLRNQLNEVSARRAESERQLIERNFEYTRVKEDFDALLQEHQQLRQECDTLRHDTRQTQTLQSLVDTKESKILTLENEIRLLEDEITRLRDDGLITPNTSTSSGIDDLDKTLQAFRSNERILKSKIEMLNGEISKRECELYTLQSRLEMVDKQQQDQNHHINVLKEQVKTREHKISMLTADAEDLRKRIKEKENLIEKKTKAVNTAQAAKRQSETELAEIKDQLDIKDRKISLLQRKIENLEDLLNDKENQLTAAQTRLSRITTERVGSDNNRSGWEETLKDKDRQIERLKEARQRTESETGEEIEAQKRLLSELRTRLESTQRELDDKTNQLIEMREEMSEIRAQRFKLETEFSQIQTQLNQRNAELTTIQMEKQLLQKQISTESDLKYSQRITDLENQLSHYVESASKLQSENDRLLRSLDSEKFDKDNQLHELREELRESQNNLNNLKRTQQNERKKHTQQIEEAKQREENLQADTEILKNMMNEKESRIRELEQALRESIRLTAEREIYASGRDDETRHLEQQVRELRSNMEHLQRERNTLSAQLVSAQEELSDRENQLKTMEQECFQNYLPELEKLRRSNHEANLRVAAMIKLSQGREHSLTEQDRVVLSTIPLFPNLTLPRNWSGIGGTSENIGLTGRSGYLGPYHTSNFGGTGISAGGSVSPHLVGSAFQLIGTTSSGLGASIGGRASVPGQPISSPDVIMLTKMLQDKENMLQQHLQELTRLRFQNSELEIRLKAAHRELDNKATRLNLLESNQYSTNKTCLGHELGISSPSENLIKELTELRKINQELKLKFNQLQIEFDDHDGRIRNYDRSKITSGLSGTEFSEMATLRRELASVKAEREVEVASITTQLEMIKRSKDDINEKLNETKINLNDKIKQFNELEAEKDKQIMEKEALQKKYESVLNQLSEKSERLKQLEQECYTTQADEIKRQKSELDDLKHHISYLQNTLKEREARIESVEKESFKLRDELTNSRKQYTTIEAELKSLREDANYREERLKQLQAQHTEELARLRCTNQELSTRIGHMEMKLDEKEHQLKTQSSEIRCQIDEITRLQTSVDDTTNRLNISQKRTEERENRLRKLESENHDLLDEIHGLRKGNTELESQVDSLRQRLLDRQESTDITTTVSSKGLIPSSRIFQTNLGISTGSGQELEKLRKQYSEIKISYEAAQKSLEETQIQCDQIKIQRDNLQTQIELEIEKRHKLEEKLHSLEKELQNKLTNLHQSTQSTETTTKLEELKRELERKEAQISCISKQLDRQQSMGSANADLYADSTNQQLLITDLQVRLRQAIEDRDMAREQLSTSLSRTEASTLEMQQQFLLEKQTLEQQISSLTQSVQNITADTERYQRESKQASARVQQLSRQLQETQNNCDSIARERDGLRDQLDQFKRGIGRTGTGTVSSVVNLFGLGSTSTSQMRPASAGPGNYENTLFYGGSLSTSQLSREMDRLHREYENIQIQLKTSQNNEQSAQNRVNELEDQINQLNQAIEQYKQNLKDIEMQKLETDKELVNAKQQIETQTHDLKDKLTLIQQQLIEKSNQLENATNQLNSARQYCTEMEQRNNEISQRLNRAESHTQNQADELQHLHQLEIECSQLRNRIDAKDTDIQHLNLQLDQLNREYRNVQNRFEQSTIELSNNENLIHQLKQELEHLRERNKEYENLQTKYAKAEDHESVELLRNELNDVYQNRQILQQQYETLQNDLIQTRNQLDEKSKSIEMLENNYLKKQAEEIANLQKELNMAHLEIEELGGTVDPSGKSKGPPLKVEIDTLKRELNKRDDLVSRMEKECQEKHLRRIETMQSQLRRFEEEAANLNQVLDEQRVGLEERDRLIRQLRSDQNQGSLVELEKLKAEHASCKEKIEQLNRRINTLNKQVEDQSDEILTIKLEALTASLCEKEANIALMELTAPKNATSNQALEKLRTERDQLQIQQKQLSNTRAMLMEEKLSRR